MFEQMYTDSWKLPVETPRASTGIANAGWNAQCVKEMKI